MNKSWGITKEYVEVLKEFSNIEAECLKLKFVFNEIVYGCQPGSKDYQDYIDQTMKKTYKLDTTRELVRTARHPR